ncbi:very low-density lipoprotein receptor-like [Mytilus californianus]|uniref:very low-density lipoprotein receptor-like n=1 Tax=Mytilus californianus TaxID=6549 RepID=UPI00224843A8|nr:very low-density lipoprotein receptor-like [Mytilus californianus]
MVKCEDKVQCIYEMQLCSEYPDCRDNSDESPKICTKDRTCPTGMSRCSENDPMCIYDSWFCNNQPECKHREDESPNSCFNRPKGSIDLQWLK